MKGLKSFLVQFVPVLLGVYIGIIGSNWNAKKGHKKEQQVFLSNIKQELQSNKARMEGAFSYHDSLTSAVDSFYTGMGKKEQSEAFFEFGNLMSISGWKGIGIAGLENSIYESGKISNTMSGLDFKTISQLAKIYKAQKGYEKLTEGVMDRMMSMDFSTTNLEVAFILALLVRDVKMAEQLMVESYSKVLVYLEEQL